MKSYEDIVKELGGFPKIVNKIIAWRAYKDGKILVFSDKNSAKEYSDCIEKFNLNQEEYDLSFISFMKFKVRVQTLWETELRVDYLIEVSPSVFDICLCKAYGEYDLHFSANTREIILDRFHENIIFAKEILSCETGK